MCMKSLVNNYGRNAYQTLSALPTPYTGHLLNIRNTSESVLKQTYNKGRKKAFFNIENSRPSPEEV